MSNSFFIWSVSISIAHFTIFRFSVVYKIIQVIWIPMMIIESAKGGSTCQIKGKLQVFYDFHDSILQGVQLLRVIVSKRVHNEFLDYYSWYLMWSRGLYYFLKILFRIYLRSHTMTNVPKFFVISIPSLKILLEPFYLIWFHRFLQDQHYNPRKHFWFFYLLSTLYPL